MYGVKSRSAMIRHDEKPFALQQSNIDKHIKNKLNYFRNVQRQLDAQATKAASIQLRKDWMQKQKKINYQNEYDRIRGEIAHSTVKGLSTTTLKNRQKVLEGLGAQAISGISN